MDDYPEITGMKVLIGLVPESVFNDEVTSWDSQIQGSYLNVMPDYSWNATRDDLVEWALGYPKDTRFRATTTLGRVGTVVLNGDEDVIIFDEKENN